MAHAEKEAFGFLFNEQVATIFDTFNVIKSSTCDSPIICDWKRQIYSNRKLKIDDT